MNTIYVAVTHHYWGRGLTEEEALAEMAKAGGKRKRGEKTAVYRITYPDFVEDEDGTRLKDETTGEDIPTAKPYVDEMGYVCHHGTSEPVATFIGKVRVGLR